jgi:hypothetical protein
VSDVAVELLTRLRDLLQSRAKIATPDMWYAYRDVIVQVDRLLTELLERDAS